jgi:chitin synthase
MAGARKVLSYRYVQGTSSAPTLHDDDDDDYDYDDGYQDDGDGDYDDYDIEQPQIPSQGHSPSGGSRTLQYALGSSSSQPPGIPTFDSIAEAVTKLQSRFSVPSSSTPTVVPSVPSTGAYTPPYERPPSSASSDTYTVATDYAAPSKVRQANRFQPTTRPSSQQPPFLPTIDSGEPLEWDNVGFIAEEEDPFSDGSQSYQQPMPPYANNPLRRHSLDSSASHDRASSLVPAEETLYDHHHHPPRPPSQLSTATSRSTSSSNRGPSSVSSVTPSQWHVAQLPASSQDRTVGPTVGLISRPNPAQLPRDNSYDPFQSQALTPPMNRIIQRRSPLKPVSPIDHFRHDTEAYASGRNSLPSYTVPPSPSPSPTPAVGDDTYEADVSQHHTGTSHYIDTDPTVTSQYTGETEGIHDEEYDEDGKGEDDKKDKPKSKFQAFLDKARSQGDAFLNQTLKEKAELQNVFADPRRVVFPNTMSDVPETPVETRHFGPAPIGRVARRNKTTKCVPLTNGNLVLDLPVPPKLVLPRTGHPEVMKTRYTAVTCDPDDFEKNGHFLRQNQMNRRTELFICITMYNVSRWTQHVDLSGNVKSVPRKTRSYSAGHYTASCVILRTCALVKTRIHGALRRGRRWASEYGSACPANLDLRWLYASLPTVVEEYIHVFSMS